MPKPDQPTDAATERAISRVLAGDREAFATVVRRFERPLRAWLATHAPPGVDVDDIAQASFIAAYTRLSDYTSGTNFAAWLFTIARYQLQTETTRLRRIADYHSRYAPDLLARELDRRAGQPTTDDDQQLAQLAACLEAIDHRRRQFLTWRYDEAIPLSEMAKRSGRSVAAVKKQLWLLRRQQGQRTPAPRLPGTCGALGRWKGSSASMTDRSFHWLGQLAYMAVLASLLLGLTTLSAAGPPNIVLIMADDLGYGELGCYGATRCQTPRLDQLAATGLRLTDFHSNGSVCSPTRAALMTGRYQQRCGIDGVVTAKKHRDAGMPIVEETLAELLSQAGYATGIFGKWHLGYAPSFSPTRQGFAEFSGFVSGNIDLFSHIDQEGWYDWWQQQSLVAEPGYAPHLLTEHGIDFIHRHKDQPFFLYLPHPAPHYPYQGPGDAANRTIRQGPSPSGLAEVRTVPALAGNDAARAYREMVEDLDTQVGRIIDALESCGLRDNTLLVFCSDNGGIAKPGIGGDNGPLRGRKGQLYEGGHRVPAILNWPGKIRPGVSEQTALTFDLLPTFAELAGATPTAEIDGTSLTDLLVDNRSLPARPLAWLSGPSMAYREGPWKLLIQKRSVELYNLEDDLAEAHDLAAEQPERVRQMQAAAEKLRAQIRGTTPMQTGS